MTSMIAQVTTMGSDTIERTTFQVNYELCVADQLVDRKRLEVCHDDLVRKSDWIVGR